jgi:hypothetical protein
MQPAVIGMLSVALLAGCATGTRLDASAVSAVPPAGQGRIVFYRLNGVFGNGMRPEIRVDGVVAGHSVPGTKFYFDSAPGSRQVEIPNSLYSGGRGLQLFVKESEVVYVRTSIGGSGFGGRTNVELVSSQEGTREAAPLDLVKF